ncbi:hypothetical protein [Silvibacterium dinghuense]|uniref:hypothetical protein n=1 Tax=Silvibacterium dinghuense TaxID=1560006 RepID=UPI0013E97A87|nr:hypothetical protein [Silvibacterium dinghuense]
MRLLYVVFVVSMIALIWAVLSVRRHIRDHDHQRADILRLGAKKEEDPLERGE